VADAQAPALRAAVSAAAPATPADPVVSAYRACLTDRYHTDDPAVTPASCQALATAARPAGPRAQQVLATAAGEANRQDFTTGLRVVLAVTAGAMALTFGLAFLLPRAARPDWAE
jgi:uncharacterized membrane protein